VSALSTLQNLAISPTGFVFDPRSGTTFTVNATGRIMLEGMRDGMNLEELIGAVSSAFDSAGADLRRDVLEYARMMRQLGLVPTSYKLS
jgi:hypothetical protein